MSKSFPEKLPRKAIENTPRLVTANHKITLTVQLKTIYLLFIIISLFIVNEIV